jgi:Na+/H+ antiporter NhaD/arsenite permease-like protein
MFPDEFAVRSLARIDVRISDPDLARLSMWSLGIVITLAGASIASSFLGWGLPISLPFIALAAAAPILVFSPRRLEIVRGIDYPTLIFFAAMFVLMASVWQSGYFQSFIPSFAGSPLQILAISIILPQFVSNVPFVALCLPVMMGANVPALSLMALAAGSTIAGNLTILGAASNVIIIENAERQGQTFTFTEFARVGIPITLIQAVIFGIYFSAIGMAGAA